MQLLLTISPIITNGNSMTRIDRNMILKES